jgi:nicotinate dehydrogenase subunit B
VREPAGPEIGFMPSFRYALSDAQIAELAAYMRLRFAPGKPPWTDLPATSAKVRLARTIDDDGRALPDVGSLSRRR